MNDRLEGPPLLAYLRQQRDPMIHFLRNLVEIETPSSEPDTQYEVRAVLANELESMDFKTVPIRGIKTGGHLYARPRHKGHGTPTQLMIGHYDTVWPLGALAERPFSVDGSIVRGPGVFDMKGGLTQMIFALKALAALDLSPPLLPVIFVNGDEEIGSHDSGRYVHQLARRAARAFVLEPAMGSGGTLKTARKGIGRFTVTVHGKAAHAGLDPEGGASAILELSHVIQSLFALNDPSAGVSINVGMIDGGMRPNVIAPLSQAIVDVRVPSAAAAERIEQQILGLQPTTPGVRLRIEGGIGRPALEPTPRNQALWQHARQIGKTLGLELEQGAAGGGSDGNTTSLYTATLDGLGPVGDGAHAVHEYLDIDRTIERTALLASLLLAPPLAPDDAVD